jgi:hypothetical protein
MIKPGQTITCDFAVSNPLSGAAVNADSLPTGVLVIDGVDNGATVTIANKSTGNYSASVTVPGGTTAGATVQIRVTAVVNTVTGKGVVFSDVVDTKRTSDLNDLSASDLFTIDSGETLSSAVAGSVVGEIASGTMQPIRSGTAQAGTASTITLDAGASAVNNFYRPALIHITAGTGAGQARWGMEYVGSTRVLTVSPDWATSPSSDSVFVIYPIPNALLADVLDIEGATNSYGAFVAGKLRLFTSAAQLETVQTFSDGNILSVVKGHTFEFMLSLPASEFGDLTGYTGKLGVTKITSNAGTAALQISAAITDANTENQRYVFNWTSAQTGGFALSPGVVNPFRINPATVYAYTWTASATDAGSNCPVFGRGWVDVKSTDTTCT